MKSDKQLGMVCFAALVAICMICITIVRTSDNEVKREEMRQNKDTKRSFNFGFGNKEEEK
jgi:hypothetical protein